MIKKINGLILRSKARWVEGGEKNSKYFANLEKRNFESKVIHKLDINGNIETDQKTLLKEEKTFYEKLYAHHEEEESDSNFFPDNYDKKLTNDEKLLCEGLITEEECKIALKTMENNKSPGSDGITCEFYKIFWNDVSKFFLDSINYSYNIGTLNPLQKQSIVTLLPKKDKDLTKLSNWRPISLLNVDYKIATKVIANRIKKILPSIIDDSQTGFVKGRYIGENIRVLLDILSITEETEIPGLLFFADFEKAFDSINHKFLLDTLQFLNFGPSLINWVKVFYDGANGCVCNNGYLSESFKIERGVRQGCPLSPYLFILAIEILSYAIRHHPDIKGIKICNKEIKNIMFADDATLALDGSERSFKTVIHLLEDFKKISGLKLNSNKTTVLRIGSLIDTNVEYMEERQFNWTSTEAKTLGITFNTNRTKLIELNLNPKLKEFEKCIENWKKRNLTTLGKITVLKTFALPKLIYPLTVLSDPTTEVMKDIKNKMNQFIWNSKVNKVSHNTIIKDYKQGGLRMIDIDNFLISLKASWVKRLIINDGSLWKVNYEKMLQNIGGKFFFECNCHFSHVQKLLPDSSEFLRNVLESWCKINYKEDIPVLEQTLWNNSKIKGGENKPLVNTDWIEKGIKYIKDIVLNKRIMTFSEFKRKFGMNDENFLSFHKLVSSIPRRWKLDIAANEEEIDAEENYVNLITKVKSIQKPCKFFYNILISRIKYTVKATKKWEALFDNDSFNWENYFNLPFQNTIDTKLRNFQYKFLLRILPTNIFLLKCKKVSSSLCDFCNEHRESIIHLFWECPFIQEFWGKLRDFLVQKGHNIELNKSSICFGIPERGNEVSNTIILCAKYYIYCCKFRLKCTLNR